MNVSCCILFWMVKTPCGNSFPANHGLSLYLLWAMESVMTHTNFRSISQPLRFTRVCAVFAQLLSWSFHRPLCKEPVDMLVQLILLKRRVVQALSSAYSPKATAAIAIALERLCLRGRSYCTKIFLNDMEAFTLG